jgi:hypothetical protein
MYICWTQTEMSYAVIATTIPTAQRLMMDLMTYYHGGGFNNTTTQSGTGTRAGEAYRMRTLGGKARQRTEVTGKASPEERNTDGDDDSQELIIRKNVDVDVTFE